VRKLCSVCKKEIENKNPKVQTVLESVFDKSEIPQTSKLWQAVGCEKCNQTGYKGRVGIYEGILMDAEVNKVVEMGSSAQEIKTAALPQGLLTMAQDGVIKALQGVTSIEELERVIEISI
jgi:type II secretory ATPase GspE/PulE/Tfp pilus assembly ATPase PilB-like protein